MKNKLFKYFPYLLTILCVLYFWWAKEYSLNIENIEQLSANVNKSWIDNYPIIKFMLPYVVGAMLGHQLTVMYYKFKRNKRV